ncbi:YdeI/OmpD-associated family protein [Palleronia sp. KMU-117]|uniref:YdeI/OmpD-associated family protein n=1 Tax=Palleronia sp. KMU-117 TaxID=3434108 RepID=UPI003D713B0B
MSDWLTFEGVIEPVLWGETTYTILRLPREVAEALEATGARRVEGEFGEHPVNLALTRAEPTGDGVFLWAGKSLLAATGLEPGDVFEVRLRPAPEDAVDTPDDVAHALQSAGRTADWEALTPGKRRGLLYKIATAKTETTRHKRIAQMLADLQKAP